MNQIDAPSSTAPSGRRPGARLRAAAVAILACGLVGAVTVWIVDDDASTGPATSYRIVGGQVDVNADAAARDRQSERLGGQALVRTAALNRWLGSLWHGRRLAWTLGVLAIVLAAACARIAALMDATVDD